MDRREFTAGIVTTALGASIGGAGVGMFSSKTSERPLLEQQQRFLDLRFGMYIHLNMATYQQREWGDPKASPDLSNPKNLDTDQWAYAAQSAGMAYGCLTTKHHDGFCLWPTATSSPSVRQAAYQEDIVRAYVDSFRQHGLKVCLYFSVLDLRANIRPYVIKPEKVAMIKE